MASLGKLFHTLQVFLVISLALNIVPSALHSHMLQSLAQKTLFTNSFVPMGLLGISINLLRRRDRKKSHGKFVACLPLDKHVWLDATDGNAMAKRSGTVKSLGGGKARLSCSSVSGQDRETYLVRHGKAFQQRPINSWGMLGATLSHQRAVELAREHLSNGTYDACLIMEDDCTVSGKLGSCLSDAMTEAIERLTDHRPGWLTLQLGSLAIGKAKSKRKIVLKDQNGVGIRVAERCYLTHAYLVRPGACDALLVNLKKGMTPGGALVALQNRLARKGKQACFFCHPSIILQCDQDSDTCLHGTWSEALQGLTPVKKCRSAKKASKKAVKGLRKRVGALGGAAKAGNGSTRKDIVVKVNRLKKKLGKTGETHCSLDRAKKEGVSYSLWKQHFQSC